MIITGRVMKPGRRLRRWTALVSTLTSVAALSLALAAPASASAHVRPSQCSTFYDVQLSLENAPSYGLYDENGGPYIAVKAPDVGVWQGTYQGMWTADGISGASFEYEIATDAGCPTGYCLGDTLEYGWTVPVACGANGTSWVQVYNGDGVFYYNRYFLNKGSQWVLVDIPNSGEPAYIAPPSDVGGAVFGRWNSTVCEYSCP
jgi:hypothetical protein